MNTIYKFFTKSIKRQLILGIALVHAVMMSIFVYDLVDRQRDFLYEQSLNKGISLTKTLSANSSSWLLSNDIIGLEEVIDSIRHYPNVIYSMVLNKEGHILAHSDRKLVGKYLSDEKSINILKSPSDTYIVYQDKNTIDIMTPILRDTQHIGWARIALNQDEIDAGLYQVTYNGVIYTCMAIFIGIIFAYFMSLGLSKGISQIIDVMQKTKDDDKLRTNLNREDEIGTLSLEFDKMLDSLAYKENIIQNVIETIPDLILLKDYKSQNGKYIDCNNAFCKLVKKKKEEIIGKDSYEILGEKAALISMENDKKVLSTHSMQSNEEWLGHPDGKKVLFDTVKVPFYDSKGEILGIIAICRDMTTRKKQEEKINDLNKTLEQKVKDRTAELTGLNSELTHTIESLKLTQSKLLEAEKMASLGGLVAGVAHEINTPVGIGLTGITHFLAMTEKIQKDYFEDNISKDDFEKYLDTSINLAKLINTNLDRTAHLIKSFKQVAIDQTSEETREFYLKEYIEEVVFSLHNITKKTNLDIKIECDKDIHINSYPGSFSQIITNLIINSIKHGYKGKEEGIINIEMFKKDNYLQIVFQDDGIGIPKENLNKIFDPFFTTNRNHGGTGLGLNIVYNIVTNNLNGSIECESVVGKGAKFSMKIPLS